MHRIILMFRYLDAWMKFHAVKLFELLQSCHIHVI